jgi:hypothetical protein
MTWGAIGGAAIGVVGSAMMGGGGGGSSGGGGSGGTIQNGIPLGLLAQVLGGGSALNDLFGSGPNSLSGMTQTAATASDPFATQRPAYQSALSSGTGAAQTIASNTASGQAGWGAGNLAALAGENTQSAYLNANTGISPQLQALSTPTAAQDFAYSQGQDAMARSAAAGGYSASGRQMMEAQAFGQKSAAQFEQQDFNNAMAAQQQGYGQALQTAQNNQGAQAQQFSQTQGLFNSGLAQSQLAGNQQSTINQQLLTSSGASTGSPAAAGQVLAGKYGNQQTALLQLLQSVQGGTGTSLGTLGSGISSGLSGLVNGITNWFNGSSGNSSIGPVTGSTDYGSSVAQTSSVQDLSQGYTVTDLGAYQGAV